MSAILCIVGVILVGLWFAWLRRQFIRAPWGYENATGFHFGKPPRKAKRR